MNAVTPGPMQEGGLQAGDLGAFGAISLRLSVELGAMHLPLRELVDLQPGSIHVLDRCVDQPVDVLVNDRLIARGEIVSMGERFAVRLTEILAGAAR